VLDKLKEQRDDLARRLAERRAQAQQAVTDVSILTGGVAALNDAIRQAEAKIAAPPALKKKVKACAPQPS
jgi:hypothetical protein